MNNYHSIIALYINYHTAKLYFIDICLIVNHSLYIVICELYISAAGVLYVIDNILPFVLVLFECNAVFGRNCGLLYIVIYSAGL